MNPNSATKDLRKVSTLRKTLVLSQREAVSSSFMTATGDNFFNAFAVFLQASAMQISSLTAIPQFVGAIFQLASVWLVQFIERKKMVVFTALFQALVMFLLAALATAAWQGLPTVRWLIVLAVFYHACLNLIQPQWRAWMGSLVPAKRRGVFFATRSRLSMAVSLLVFIFGGAVLTFTTRYDATWFGFVCIFVAAGLGRFISSQQFLGMHDPDPHPHMSDPTVILNTLQHCREALRDTSFRQYSFFVAGMQAMVAISAPFFAVYMLDELQWTYLQFSLNSLASIVMQFLTFGLWGRVADRYGNRLVLIVSSLILPVLPILWLVSNNFYYLLLVQLLSGLGWSGFSLSSANYLYDIRPHRSNFALYAALQSTTQAACVFFGALLGGWVATHSLAISKILPFNLASPLFVVFILSFVLRSLMSLWFITQAKEPYLRFRPSMLRVVYRVARFNPISGAVLDWLTVVRKQDKNKPRDKSKNV